VRAADPRHYVTNEEAAMRGRLAGLAIVLIVGSLAGAALRAGIEPPAESRGLAAQAAAERQAADRSLPLAYVSLAIAGLALMLDDRWPARAAGGFLAIASGLLINLPGAFWLLGSLVGIVLLIAVSIAGRVGQQANSTS
jgi:hypothetical protein